MLKIKYIDNSTIKQFNTNQIGCAYFSTRLNEYSQQQNKLNVYCEYVLLKNLLKSINIDLDKQTIIKTSSGKPIFDNLKIFFNISHNKDLVAVAISSNPIGIDIQAISPYNAKVAQKYFNTDEFTAIEKSKNKDIQFTKYWTKYESMLKLFGSRKEMFNKNVKVNTKFKNVKDLNNTKYSLCISTSKHISLDNPTTLW